MKLLYNRVKKVCSRSCSFISKHRLIFFKITLLTFVLMYPDISNAYIGSSFTNGSNNKGPKEGMPTLWTHSLIWFLLGILSDIVNL